jgi:hypothetical protein
MWESQVLRTQQKGQKTRGRGSVDPRNHTEHLLSKSLRTTFGALACWRCASAKIGMTLVHYFRVFQLLHVRKTACTAGNESWHSYCLQLAPRLYMPTKTRKFLNFYCIAAKKLPLRASFILIFSTKSSDFEHTEHICSPIMRVSMVLNDVFLSPCQPSVLYIQYTAFPTSLIISSVEVRFQQRMPCDHNHYRFSCVTTLPPRTTSYNRFSAFGNCSASSWIGTCRCCGGAQIFLGLHGLVVFRMLLARTFGFNRTHFLTWFCVLFSLNSCWKLRSSFTQLKSFHFLCHCLCVSYYDLTNYPMISFHAMTIH